MPRERRLSLYDAAKQPNMPSATPLNQSRRASPTPGESSSSDKKESDIPSAKAGIFRNVKEKFMSDVDYKECVPISLYACFLTGFTSSTSFSACYIWCGFQTGNLAQLGLALARTFAPSECRTYGFQKPDQQALVSLLTFIMGAFTGRLGDKLGNRSRRWLVSATVLQVLLAVASALTAHFSGEDGIALERGAPSWDNALGMVTLGFLSASMGVQGIVGKRIASPMNTTVVLTTTWVELFNDPFLFAFKSAPSRDVRIIGVTGVFLGAFISRAILQTAAGQAGCLGVLAGLRSIQAVWWFLVPNPNAV